MAFQKDSQTWYGYVSHIYKLPDYQGRILVAVKVLVDPFLYDGLEASESFWQTLHDLELSPVWEERTWELLDPSELVAVCAYWPLSAWTFKHHKPLMVLRQIPHESLPFIIVCPHKYQSSFVCYICFLTGYRQCQL